MTDYKDMCKVDRILPIHQLNKINEKGDKRFNFFPLSVVQAIFDKTGIRLDTIISSFNYIFLPWKGTKEATRLQVVGLMRRKSLVVCYRDLDDNTTIEMYIGTDKGDNAWKDDVNWKDFRDWLKEYIEEIFSHLEDYPDIWEEIKDIISQAVNSLVKTFVDNWLNTNGEQIINDYLSQLDLSNQLSQLINQYLQGDEFNQLLNDIVNKYVEGLNLQSQIDAAISKYLEDKDFTTDLENIVNNYFNGDTFGDLLQTKVEKVVNNYLTENLQPAVDDAIGKVQEYITSNERVVANALSRHEEDLQNLKTNTDAN